MLTTLLVLLAFGPTQSAEFDAMTLLEATWNHAHLRGDAAALERLLADDLVVVVPGMRPLTKAESLAVLTSGRMTFERYETTELALRVYDATAIVTGRLRRTRAMAGGAKADDDWRFTKVYLKRSGAWQVISFHASSVAP